MDVDYNPIRKQMLELHGNKEKKERKRRDVFSFISLQMNPRYSICLVNTTKFVNKHFSTFQKKLGPKFQTHLKVCSSTQCIFPLCDGASQMFLSPEKVLSPLNKVNMRLLFAGSSLKRYHRCIV